MDKLSKFALEIPLLEGAVRSGIVTTEGLEGGPPSADISYVLEGAKSAVSFAIAMDADAIPPYLMKEDRTWLENEMIRANVMASGIAFHLSNYLNNQGHESIPVAANIVFRPADEDSDASKVMSYPDIAHRYLAVKAGLGFMGMSGNIIIPEVGAAVILGSVVTRAELEPTPPLRDEDSYCDDCKLCLASCVARFMDFKTETKVELGETEVKYSSRRNIMRCDLVCSGYTGLSPNGRWSTWSPGRFAIPKKDEDLPDAYERITQTYSEWPKTPGGRRFFYTDEKLRVSCANCQMVCAADPEERKRRMKMLKNSGVVVQNEDGSLEAVSAQEAKNRLEKMPPERRVLYEDK